jgi:hypothetical protein
LTKLSSARAGALAARSATSALVAARAEREDRENRTIEMASFHFKHGNHIPMLHCTSNAAVQ